MMGVVGAWVFSWVIRDVDYALTNRPKHTIGDFEGTWR